MSSPSNLLVIDHNADSGILLVRGLSRKFPGAAVQLCTKAQTLLDALSSQTIDAIILHRTEEEDAVTLIQSIRRINPDVVIIAVSGLDRSEQVLAAGATGFMNYEQWLMIGTVVANALANRTERIRDLVRMLAKFERTRDELVQRRHGMSDSAMVIIDDRVALNERTITALKQTLELTKTGGQH